MNPFYNRKLQSALIDTVKKVAAQEHKKTPTMDDLQALYEAFTKAVASDDMKAQSVASGELITGLVKWRVERV